MYRRKLALLACIAVVFGIGVWCGRMTFGGAEAAAAKANRVFEIRTYTTHEGKLADLNARFRNHTTKLFAKHGMKNVGYWTPIDAPRSENTLIYVLAHESREAAKKSWDGFRNDPQWKRVRDASEANGKTVSRVESIYLDPTDYSPLK